MLLLDVNGLTDTFGGSFFCQCADSDYCEIVLCCCECHLGRFE